MAHKYLGERFDIHTGGVDNVFPHHEDEIAQSEGAFGGQHVNYWVHGQHLLADGAKMAKSAGNVFLIEDLASRGFDPLAFRYLCMTVRYRHRMNFTFTSLRAAEKALTGLRNRIWVWRNLGGNGSGHHALTSDGETWRGKFWDAVHSDLDLPTALAVTWDMVRSELPPADKLELMLDFDRVFGLDLSQVPERYEIGSANSEAIARRATLREQAAYADADLMREEVVASGMVVEDIGTATRVRPQTPLELQEAKWSSVSASREVPSLLDEPDLYEFSFVINAYDYVDDVRRCVEAILRTFGRRVGRGHRGGQWFHRRDRGIPGSSPGRVRQPAGDPLRPRGGRRGRQEHRAEAGPGAVRRGNGRPNRGGGRYIVSDCRTPFGQ